MKEVDAKFMSYETGKKELVKCRAYMKHFSLQLFTKRKVENMIDGEEKQIRFMFFCMVLSQFQCKFIDFFESENIQLNLFLDNIVKSFPFIFQSSKLNLVKSIIFSTFLISSKTSSKVTLFFFNK